MATKQKASRRSTGRSSSKGLICPECGFKAAHPMGLGRHRSSRHNVASKRELQRRSLVRPSRGRSKEVTALMKRLEELEQRYDRLMTALSKASRGRARR
jgi:hypothetical protein